MGTAIRLHDIHKRFGSHQAVASLSFDVQEGSIFGLLGRNGAGKSTTIRMILDILRPDQGSIQIFGAPLSEPSKDRIGYLPEERGLYPKMKVLETLQFQASLKGMGLADAKRRASDWLDRMELGDWKQKKVEELSKGMQQKVQFISAIMHEPDLLILDEPFSGMDPVNQELFKRMIAEVNRKGATIVFSTHVMSSAEELCRDIALIDKGQAALLGSLEKIKDDFGSNTVRLWVRGDNHWVDDLPDVNRVERDGRYMEVELRDGVAPQALLEKSIAHGEVRHFEIVLPTLHNIFIQQVGGELEDA